MSLESRAEHTRQEAEKLGSPYPAITNQLINDSDVLWVYWSNGPKQLNSSTRDTFDALVDLYEIDGFVQLSDLKFLSGFEYITNWCYPLISLASINNDPAVEAVLNRRIEALFYEATATPQTIRDELAIDPTGTTWLEEMAEIELRTSPMELMGARKAILGAKKLYEAITAG